MTKLMELINAYAAENAAATNAAMNYGRDSALYAKCSVVMLEARTAVVEAVEKLEMDAARWDFYRKQTGPDAPNPFWCLRVIDGELDRMVDKAMEATK